MVVTSLTLADFRNYGRFDLRPHPVLTVLVGPNAVGKTNIIESLQLVTAATSFRRPRWEDLVRRGADSARVSMSAEEGERRLEVVLDAGADGTHAFKVNGQTKRRTGDVAGRLPSVTFTPDDLALVKGSAERRRGAIDDLGTQISPGYANLRRDYGRVVRQRNALLKDDPGADTTAWDDQLVALGSRLAAHRLRLLAKVMEAASAHYADMAAGESLSWSYDDRCGLGPMRGPAAEAEADNIAGCIRAEIARRSGEERRRGVTLVGPHRDDVVFAVGGEDARSFASQGQQRTAALAWKLAEVDVIEEVLRARPLLLLDDVMSELDASRRDALSAVVTGRTQTFVTTTNLGYFDKGLLADASVVELAR